MHTNLQYNKYSLYPFILSLINIPTRIYVSKPDPAPAFNIHFIRNTLSSGFVCVYTWILSSVIKIHNNTQEVPI
jgi:hypothetical protein